MIRVPSVDSIETIGGIDRETAIKIRRLLDRRDDPESYEAGRRRVAECFHRPDDIDLILSVVNSLLDTHGVEGIQAENYWDRYYCDTVAIYCNNGDSYAGTVLYDVDREVFYVTSWADWVETAEKRRYKFR